MMLHNLNNYQMETNNLLSIATQLTEMHPAASTSDIITITCDIYEETYEVEVTDEMIEALKKTLK